MYVTPVHLSQLKEFDNVLLEIYVQ